MFMIKYTSFYANSTLLVYVTIYERNVTDGISSSCLRNEQSCFDDKKLISTQYQTLFPLHLVERAILRTENYFESDIALSPAYSRTQK